MPASEWFGRPLPTDLEGLAHATAAIMNGQDLYRGLATAHLGVHSPYNCSPAFIHEAKACAMSLGVRFGIHLAECNSELEIILERYGKTPVRHLHDLGVLDSSVIADHCVWFTEEDIDLFRESGAGIVHNPLANAKLGSGTAPIRKYLDAGIPLALGTDSVVSNNSLSMFEVIKCGLMIQRAVYPSGDGPPLGALDFLCMATKGGAQVLGMQDRIGMLEPGMRADLIVVELPPEIPADFARVVSHLVYSAKPSDLRLVVVDGQVVVRDGEIQTVDEAKLKAESRSYFDERWQEFGLTH
jgi:5-methylthioadenosine/S-adenosylhomocysteine deaminase